MKKFSLSKNERIKEKKIFDKLYKSGKIVLSKNKSIKAIYLAEKSQEPCAKIAIGISKKAGKAVWRNRLKRLIRNAYRLNKLQLLDLAKQKNLNIYVLFSSLSLNQINCPKVKYDFIELEVISLLELIHKKINSLFN
ncbi:MAG: ribonuclease P protein component [Ignavibacterium sp.]|nr:ribonuclease P protein component [Ignavibacterium sp.]MCX7610539.1 ribonuclease P protein component [Ignavibacterium sp.]MDW8374596.1 ribonuclease P protein component [Ignavibacteriales bacterium]